VIKNGFICEGPKAFIMFIAVALQVGRFWGRIQDFKKKGKEGVHPLNGVTEVLSTLKIH
jgi:hypothetical protein